jgi:alpha-tubulin suppressor-like RCC1 family protein
MYRFGSHRDGKLGLGRELEKDIMSPVPLEALRGRKIKFAAAGCDHSAALSEENELFTWGFGQHGALGLGDLQDQFAPMRVSLPFDGQIEDIYCGIDLTMVSTYN